jgi:hypothetical protein
MSDDKNVRHRFTVPAADDVVNKWIENQSNLGFSLRVLIKAFVRGYGYKDATCLEFGVAVKKRGRPPKQANIKYDVMNENSTEFDFTDDVDDDDEVLADSQSEVNNEHIDTEVQSAPQVPDKKPATTVKTAVPQQTSGNDIMGALRNRGNSHVVSAQVAENVSSDEDGFVDPDSLF